MAYLLSHIQCTTKRGGYHVPRGWSKLGKSCMPSYPWPSEFEKTSHFSYRQKCCRVDERVLGVVPTINGEHFSCSIIQFEPSKAAPHHMGAAPFFFFFALPLNCIITLTQPITKSSLVFRYCFSLSFSSLFFSPRSSSLLIFTLV